MKVTILMPAMRGVMHVPDQCATFRFSTAGLPKPARAQAVRDLHQRERTMLRRRAAIDEIFHEDAVFYEPNGAYRGRGEIDRIAGVIKATHPDFQYQPLSPPEEIGDGCRVRWVSGSPRKPPAYAGTDS